MTVNKDWDNKTALSYFQNKMLSLADSLKEQMGTLMSQSKVERVAANKISEQALAAAVLRQAKNYEMPKKIMPDSKQIEQAQDDRG